MPVPKIRLSCINSHPERGGEDYVLYWMIAFRRPRYNFALQHAVDRARQFGKPLIIFEPLRVRYRWASDRMHRFVIEGMRDHAAMFARKPVTYYPYVEPRPGVASPLLRRLAERACTVITDEYPGFFLPHMIAAVKDKLPARLELVDSNGLIPLRQPDRTFTVAHSYRRWMQKNILDALTEMPAADPLARVRLPKLTELPAKISERWPAADLDRLLAPGGLDSIPIDHNVGPSETIVGGPQQALRQLKEFLQHRLPAYNEDRNHPDRHATTGLSPHLHFGHLSAHELVARVLEREDWTPDRASAANGKNHGFWNTSESAEALLDQLLTWREMGFNLAFRQPDSYDRYESLPDWARRTLAEHAGDPRPQLYTQQQFERAETHDEIWNAAQRELLRKGVIQNYLRMLWGKKILHWTQSPQQALSVMIELNNKYGLDGRDPNSYSGIFWVLGRYDRAWGPRRPVFGSVRYMTSENARRKLKLSDYLQRYGSMKSGLGK